MNANMRKRRRGVLTRNVVYIVGAHGTTTTRHVVESCGRDKSLEILLRDSTNMVERHSSTAEAGEGNPYKLRVV